jgi:hypothetical protein
MGPSSANGVRLESAQKKKKKTASSSTAYFDLVNMTMIVQNLNSPVSFFVILLFLFFLSFWVQLNIYVCTYFKWANVDSSVP